MLSQKDIYIFLYTINLGVYLLKRYNCLSNLNGLMYFPSIRMIKRIPEKKASQVCLAILCLRRKNKTNRGRNNVLKLLWKV